MLPHARLTAPVRREWLSHVQGEQLAYRRDPLMHRKLSLRLGAGLLDSGAWALEHADQVQIPTLVLHGDQDRITDAGASQEFAAGLAGKRSSLHAQDLQGTLARYSSRRWPRRSYRGHCKVVPDGRCLTGVNWQALLDSQLHNETCGPFSPSECIVQHMYRIALKMLFGDRAKYIGLVFGVAFSTLLINQQCGIFVGLIGRSASIIDDTPEADIWVMDPGVKNLDTVFPAAGYRVGSSAWCARRAVGGALL